MSIINNIPLHNIIGIDIGNKIMTPILNNNSIPCSNIIKFIIPNIMEEYTILLYGGNNILSCDNIYIDKIKIISPEKVIYIEFKINIILYYHNLLQINISTKTKQLYSFSINVFYNSIKFESILYVDKIIDIYNYKLKFELIQCIELIQIKLDKKEIILPDDTMLILNNKLTQINCMIDTLPNQKLLDIKNNLITKFFL